MTKSNVLYRVIQNINFIREALFYSILCQSYVDFKPKCQKILIFLEHGFAPLPSLLNNILQKWSGMASLTLAMFVKTPIVCPHSLSSTITFKVGLLIDAQC